MSRTLYSQIYFVSRDLHFQIPWLIFGISTNFQPNLISLKFCWGGAWVWSRGTSRDLGTMIFGFLVKFYLLVPIFGPIQQLFILGVGWVGVVTSRNFWVSGPWFLDSSFNFSCWCQFSAQSDEIEILRGGAWVWSKHKFRIVSGNSG